MTTYKDIEDKIQWILEEIEEETDPNIRDLAKKHDVSYFRLLRRYNGNLSKNNLPSLNKRLSDI